MIELCSVIIPVFNEEKNIEKCYKTLLKQTYKNLEIIFIDDGSTDNSVQIIKYFREINPQLNIKIYTQNNNGAAAARKKGIQQATAAYIAILDCDDELSNDAIYHAMISFNIEVDIALFDLKYKNINNGKISLNNFNYFTQEKYITGLQALLHSLDSWEIHGLGIYRKELYESAYNIYEKFNKSDNYINNDEIITRISFMLANSITITNGVYYYLNNLNSTTKRVNKKLYKKILNARILYNILSENNITTDGLFLINCMWEAKKYLKKNKNNITNVKVWKATIAACLKFVWSKNLFRGLSLKSKLKFILLKLILVRY